MAKLQVQDTASSLALLSLLVCDARNVPELRQAMLAGGRGNLLRLRAYFQRQIDAGVVSSGLSAGGAGCGIRQPVFLQYHFRVYIPGQPVARAFFRSGDPTPGGPVRARHLG